LQIDGFTIKKKYQKFLYILKIRNELKGIQNEINHNLIKKASNNELANKADVQGNIDQLYFL
jgi:hypothetical protein